LVLASRIFSSVASAAAGEAPLLAGEARCGEDRSYVYTCELLHWFANAATFCDESAGAPATGPAYPGGGASAEGGQ